MPTLVGNQRTERRLHEGQDLFLSAVSAWHRMTLFCLTAYSVGVTVRPAMKTLLFTFMLIASLAVTVQAQETATVVVVSQLYDLPSRTSRARQEVLPKTLLKLLDAKEGGWYVVRIGDAVGWMNSDDFLISIPRVNRSSNTSTVVQPEQTDPSSNVYIRGSRGGCYHTSKSGKKVYVDRSLCH